MVDRTERRSALQLCHFPPPFPLVGQPTHAITCASTPNNHVNLTRTSRILAVKPILAHRSNLLVTSATHGIEATCELFLTRAGSPRIRVHRNRSRTIYDALLSLSSASRVDIFKADLSNLGDVRTIIRHALKLVTELRVPVNCAVLKKLRFQASAQEQHQRRRDCDHYRDSDWELVVNGGSSASRCVLVCLYRVVPADAHLWYISSLCSSSVTAP